VVRQNADRSWEADYKLFSLAAWEAEALFATVLRTALALCERDLIVVGGDDTRVAETDTTIRSAHWGRDPRSPRFRVNLQLGLRFLRGSVLGPVHAREEVAARALPDWFEEVPPPEKPRAGGGRGSVGELPRRPTRGATGEGRRGGA